MTRINNHLSKVAAHHDSWSMTYDSDILESMVLYNKITLSNIKRFLPPNKDSLILDAGGGSGIWAVEVANMDYRVVLVDISQGMLEKAREKVDSLGLSDRIQIRESDITHMPEFEDGQFDMIICEGDPLSYCGDHRSAVREFARVVRCHGHVVASVDSRASALSWIASSDDTDAITKLLETGEVLHSHGDGRFSYAVHAFTPAELAELFETEGFEVCRIIGKPVIARRLSLFASSDPEIQEWLYQLELRYGDDPAYIAHAGHLEIAVRKL